MSGSKSEFIFFSGDTLPRLETDYFNAGIRDHLLFLGPKDCQPKALRLPGCLLHPLRLLARPEMLTRTVLPLPGNALRSVLPSVWRRLV